VNLSGPGEILIAIVMAPGVTFLSLSLAWLLGWTPGERLVARFTALVYSGMAAAGFWLVYVMLRDNVPAVLAPLGNWFRVGEYEFQLVLVGDRLSVPLIALTTVLIGIVGSFSVRYLHRERGFFRFFLLMHLFAFGSLLVFSAGSFDLLVAGWELAGITSVLLIAFFDERREPVRNAVRVFATYRLADLGLLLAVFVFHFTAHTAAMDRLLPGQWPHQTTVLNGSAALLAGLMLGLAAAGKSSQIPFSGWLPRAMEGPTPSSAIFYGAISIHLGAYLLLRAQPVLAAAPVAAVAVIVTGAGTALLATLAHRVSSDAKTSLAWAAMAQLGVIFVEIGLGYPQLALAHMCGHAVVRTLQFLRSPSMLRDFHRVHAAAGGQLQPTGEHYRGLLPASFRVWLFRVALERGFYDAMLDRLVTGPALRLSRWMASLEPPPGLPEVGPGHNRSGLPEAQGIKETGR
jgi:NADH:ubiquinone oxidoreductase subunit 5 (subunit L)/multisubunit Na+/H+ antiporter MnhA subunit